MKILFVAFPNSIHTARWISQLKDCGWSLHLYPGSYAVLHPDIENVRYHSLGALTYKSISMFLRISRKVVEHVGGHLFEKLKEFMNRRLVKIDSLDMKARRLVKTIKRVKPDLIHSMEFQTNSYLVLHARKLMKGRFPPWLVTNWGSDIYLYRRFPEHRERIRKLLSICDYYSCETNRDVTLAKELGFKGSVLPVIPNSGGFNLTDLVLWRGSEKTSQRNIIMLKGYQGWSGRALVGIRALQRCSDILGGYEVVVYLVSGEDVEIACRLLAVAAGIQVTMLSAGQTHETIMRYHGQARISIGLSISDAASTSFLEAIAMGSFPIQSDTAAADEWIENGVTGIIVPPEDPEVIERAIRKALSDDEMVDRAAETNWRTIADRLDYDKVKEIAIGMYQKIVDDSCS